MSPPIAYKPPKPPMTLVRAPKMGEVYWCDFAISNCLPEFDDRHLIVVLKSGGYKDACHMVVPLTKQDQSKSAYEYALETNPSPGTAATSWAVCDQIYTVATERLSRLRNRRHEVLQPFRLSDADLAGIGRQTFKAFRTFSRSAIRRRLPRLRHPRVLPGLVRFPPFSYIHSTAPEAAGSQDPRLS